MERPDAAQVTQSLVGKAFGDYELVAELGRGAMGVVYRARQVSLDRPVAVKILPPELSSTGEYVHRFLREARAAARLTHQNIIQVFDAGVMEDFYFFVMEYAEGRDLEKVLLEEGIFSEVKALRLIHQAAMGLAAAHREGIIHRDIKPANLILTTQDIVKVGDLGLAKWKMQEAQALTTSGFTLGTPFYISPEQIGAQKDIDARADVYSLGHTLFHLLVGRPAYMGNSAPVIMSQHLKDFTPSIASFKPDLSQGAVDLVASMIRKDRDERLPTMGTVVNRIAQILSGRYQPIPMARKKRSSVVALIKEKCSWLRS